MPLIAKHLDATEWVAETLPAGSSHLMAGVAAGVIGSTLSHPFDTVKVRVHDMHWWLGVRMHCRYMVSLTTQIEI